MLTQYQLTQTGNSIRAIQCESGLIPWFYGGHIDPWNHIEAAIALSITDEQSRALAALDGLIALQNSDGSFCHYYLNHGVKEPNRDPNVISYIALGVLAMGCFLDSFDLERYFGAVTRAIDFVVSVQRSDGGFPMLVTPDGQSHPQTLLAGGCSILVSLEAANYLASQLDFEAPRWKEAELDLVEYLTVTKNNIADKSNWAMDWYYPALTGLSRFDTTVNFGSAAELTEGIPQFIDFNYGVRCISNKSWYTAAETAEAAIAFSLAGMDDIATRIFSSTEGFRTEYGSYLTGVTIPEGRSFPGGECSTYSAAAVVIADNVITHRHRGSLAGHFISLIKR